MKEGDQGLLHSTKTIDSKLFKPGLDISCKDRRHMFKNTKEISQVILAAMALVPNFPCKNCF